jgi:hypothetical protein
MVSLARMVDPDTWRLSDALGTRRGRLLEVPKPGDLLERTLTEASDASSKGLLPVAWKPSVERPGFFRVVA